MKSFFKSEKSSLLFVFAFFDGLAVASGALFGYFFPKLISDIFGANFGSNDLIFSIACFDHTVYDNWRSVLIHRKVGYTHSFIGDTVRRTQFTVCNYVSSTVHKLMGDTFDSLATSISSSGGPYSIWLTSQLFVIVSRVKYLRNLVFVGSKRSILLSIEQLLYKPNVNEQHVYTLLKTLTNRKEPLVLPLNKFSYIPFNMDIPPAQHGFVYLLISLTSPGLNCFYVGQTERKLLSRLYEHNTGQGSLFTSPVYRQPWAIAAFIHNFRSQSQRLRTENFVQRKFNQLKPKTMTDGVSILRDVLNTSTHKGLILSVCGKVSQS